MSTKDEVLAAVDARLNYTAQLTASVASHAVALRATRTLVEQLESTTPPPPPPGPLPALRVQGNQIVRADTSVRVVPLGTNIYGVKAYPAGGPADGMMGPVNAWHQRNPDEIATNLNGWGANWVRLICAIDDTIRPGIKTIVDANARHGIYTMLAGFNGVGFDSSGGQRAGSWLAQTWDGLGRPAHVLLNLFNEPHGITNTQWQAFTAAGIAAMRAVGYTAPIFVDSNGWAHAQNAAQIISIGDPQVVQCVHAYAYDGGRRGPGYATQMVTTWTSDQRVPTCPMEWGPYNEGQFGGSQGTLASALAEFCAEMRQQVTAAVKAGRLCGNVSWALLWNGNTQLSGDRGGDWWDIASGAEKPVLNAWGQVAAASWADLKAA